jgi:hypothetical protein
MGTRKSHTPRYRRRPPQAFWIKVALTATLISPLLPHWLLLVFGILVLALPAWLFHA